MTETGHESSSGNVFADTGFTPAETEEFSAKTARFWRGGF